MKSSTTESLILSTVPRHVTILLATAFVGIFGFWRKNNAKKRLYPPFAPVGLFKTLTEMAGLKVHWFLLDTARKTSSDVFRLPLPIPGGGLYVINHPTIAREILIDKTTDKQAALYKTFVQIAGEHCIPTRISDAQWKAVRKGTAHAFSSSQVSRMNQICARHVDKWIVETLEPLIDDPNKTSSFDPSKEMSRVTFGAIMESAFEYVVTAEENDFFTHHIEEALVEFMMKQIFNPFRKYFAFLYPSYWDARNSSRDVQEFALKVLHAYRNNPTKSSHNTLIKLIAENESLKTDRERVAEMITYMVAGFDTTGYTLSMTLMLLAKHPRVAEKLRKELLSMEPNQWTKSKYLLCVINESKRILPVTALGGGRITGRAFTFNNGKMVVPKNATVIIPSILLHRHAAIFKDPDDFYPERWDTDDDKAMKEAFIPFSLGNRNCPGQSLAMTELYTVLPQLMVRYRFHVENEGDLEFFLTLKHVGAQVRATKIQ